MEGMGEPDVSALLSVSQAIEIIDSTPVTPRVQSIDLADAHGLVLAQDILTDRDSPPFDKSLMDGYAVRARDVASERAALRCVGEIAAGAIEIKPIQPGETAAIMTGAPMPQGADAVIPVENRISIDGNIVHLAGPAMAGRYIARRGAEVSTGQLVLKGAI